MEDRFGIIEVDSDGEYFKVTADGRILHRCRIVGAMGPQVPTDIIKWIPKAVSTGQVSTYEGALPPGTTCFVSEPPGQEMSSLAVITNVIQSKVVPNGLNKVTGYV